MRGSCDIEKTMPSPFKSPWILANVSQSGDVRTDTNMGSGPNTYLGPPSWWASPLGKPGKANSEALEPRNRGAGVSVLLGLGGECHDWLGDWSPEV